MMRREAHGASPSRPFGRAPIGSSFAKHMWCAPAALFWCSSAAAAVTGRRWGPCIRRSALAFPPSRAPRLHHAQVLKRSGSPEEKRAVERIMPVSSGGGGQHL